ncbi:MAG: hypothetical protein CVT77_13400 [Alphaproteobacteria bacterium HGW-Alphaproteobacteria-16]|nr:MAG: hypothetical protein CVT77_13400 [Alphaproteobacteria bacterium HGW-Alphaproteobacteria-16]
MSDATNPFRTRTVLILVVGGLLLMLGFLLVSAYGDRFERQQGNIPSVNSRFGTGFHALYRLVALSGGTATMVQGPEDGEDAGLLILTPNLSTTREELRTAIGYREGPTLIILPKWIAAPQQNRPDREERVAMLPVQPLARLLGDFGVRAVSREEPARLDMNRAIGLRPFTAPDPVQVLLGGNLASLIDGPSLGSVLAEVKGRNIYILADPDLLNNHGLSSRTNARAAIALLAALDPDTPGDVAFDTMLPYGAGGRNLAQLMFEPPFAGVTLALLAAALLAGLATLTRFGPVRREPRAIPFGKRALIENIVALARRARRTQEGGEDYAAAIRERAARQLGLPRTLRGDARDAHLDGIRTSTPYAAWMARLENAKTEADMLHAARKLDDWRKELKA